MDDDWRQGDDSPLRLTAVPIEGTEAAVDVVLRNDGAEPIEIPFPILYPAELCLSITPEHGSRIEGLPAGGEPIPLAEAFAERPEGTEWDAGAFETATVPLGARRRTLAPNEEVRRRFTLARLFRGALAPGVYEVTPTWGNFESGRRLGLPGPLIHTGVVTRLAPGQWLYEGPVRVRGCTVVVR